MLFSPRFARINLASSAERPIHLTRNADAKHAPLVDFRLDLFESRESHQLVHLRRSAASHDPAFPFPITQHMRDELELGMPRLIRVNEIAAGLDRVGQPAQGIQHRLVCRK